MRCFAALLLATACKSEPKAPSFRRDVMPVMQRQCAGAEGCHGEKPTDSVALDLRPDAAYAALVNAPAEARAGAWRVLPGSPDASFLVDKLRGPPGRGEGKRMPIDEDTGVTVEPSPLPADYVERVLVPWIAAGAHDD